MKAPRRIGALSVAVRISGRAPRRLLDGVEIELARGAVSLLLGASGSGKTTLLHALMNEAPPGGLIISGAETLPLAPPGEVVLLPQDPAACMDPQQRAIDLVREVLPGSAARSAEALLTAFDVPPSLWQARADALSVGIAQRVQLAAVVGMEPAWLLLDEPTSAQDRLRALAVAAELKALASRGTGILVATHDLFLARALGGCAHFLSDGRVIEAAPVEVLLTQPEHPSAVAFMAAGCKGGLP